jgi:cytochrome c peroxidase
MSRLPFSFVLASLLFLLLFCSCQEDDPLDMIDLNPVSGEEGVETIFDGTLDLSDPFNYGSQAVPGYINRDNTEGNEITDEGATLGRVLFYDRALSANNTISCASCHVQELAFGDDAIASVGVSGTTGRHSMRLINARFGNEERFFWDERANSLETQATMPIRDHIEMGFSGEDGDPTFGELIERLDGLEYYNELFSNAFGNAEITEDRMQDALAQFIRSIQSFDSKYDAGRAAVGNNGANFPNFTAEENRGKQLFLADAQLDRTGNRIGGGLGCGDCHQAPEFSILPGSGNNGVITSILAEGPELDITRSPTLRDLYRPDGAENGPFMHDGSLATINDVIDHYNSIPAANQGLDRRLSSGGNPQRLNMTADERAALVAFLKTLGGTAVYTDERWSDPFGGME